VIDSAIKRSKIKSGYQQHLTDNILTLSCIYCSYCGLLTVK